MRERDYIINRVIRRFKARAEEHNVDVSVVDLRWGITPQEAKDGRVLEICLRQIDSCRPLFIGVIGGRYGWCPSYNDFLQNDFLRTQYPEVEEYFKQGLSITEMEMQYGAINSKKETDAIFFLRELTNEELKKEGVPNILKLREKITANTQIPYYTYTDSDLTAFEFYPGSLGDHLSEWLDNELKKYFPDKKKGKKEAAPRLNTKEQRKNYLIEVLTENGKSVSDQQTEIILASEHTQTKEGLDSFIEDLLTFGVFEELDTFINWRANVNFHDYCEKIFKRRLSVYTTSMIHTIQVVAITKQGADYDWLRGVFSQDLACERDFDSSLSLFLEDAISIGLIKEVQKKYLRLCVITDNYRDLVSQLLLPSEDAIERTRIRLIEAILGCETYNQFLEYNNPNDLSYRELVYQKNLCPSLDNYECNQEQICKRLVKQISGFDYKDIKQIQAEGLNSLDDYRRVFAYIKIFMEHDCVKNDVILYNLMDFINREGWPDNLESQDGLSKEEFLDMKFLYDEAVNTLLNSDNEYVWECVCDWRE